MTTLGDIARSTGFVPILRIQHGDSDPETDLWRCPVCFAVVRFEDVLEHKGWHDQAKDRQQEK